MWWKIYFWILLLLTVFGLLSLLPAITTWNFAMWVSAIENILLLIGLYAYIYKKKVFTKTAWKYIFYILVVGTVLGLALFVGGITIPDFFIPNTVEVSTSLWIISTSLFIPAFVTVYRLGFSEKKK